MKVRNGRAGRRAAFSPRRAIRAQSCALVASCQGDAHSTPAGIVTATENGSTGIPSACAT